jgi:hypothetical protein
MSTIVPRKDNLDGFPELTEACQVWKIFFGPGKEERLEEDKSLCLEKAKLKKSIGKNCAIVHHSPSQRPLTIWWKRFLNVVCACKQKRPEPVRIFITPIGFWGLGYERNSWTFAHTVGQQQGSVSKEQPIVGQPVVERLCTHCTTSHKRRIDRAPPTSVRDAKKQTSLRLKPSAWAGTSAHQVVLPIDHLTIPKLDFFLHT